MGPWVSTDNGATMRQATIPTGTPGQWIGNLGNTNTATITTNAPALFFRLAK